MHNADLMTSYDVNISVAAEAFCRKCWNLVNVARLASQLYVGQ